MCGIFGIADMSGHHQDANLPIVLEAMGRALNHRGPDDAGSWHAHDGSTVVGLGARRLSIIDVVGGHQPILNEEGTVVLVCNGEIYNYRELREGLQAKGHRFRTDSDCEVLVHLYEEHGWEAVTRLRGMFAFALWDRRERRLVLGRDRLGIKPLLFHHQGDRVVFASERRALLEGLDRSPDVSIESLLRLLVLKYVPGPQTALHGVCKLMPGTVAVMDQSGLAMHRYWSAPTSGQDEHDNAPDLAEKVGRLLRDAVRSHLMSDVPVGAFLSGGIDSAAVVGLMAASMQGQNPFHTFSIGFEGPEEYSELHAARNTAMRFGTIHHEIVLRPEDVSAILPGLVEHLEEPLSDPAIVPTYLLSTLASRYVKVVLTGEGADELFGGYRRYALDRFAQVYTCLPQALRTKLLSWLGQMQVNRRLLQGLHAVSDASPVKRNLSWVGTFTSEELLDVVADPLRAQHMLDSLVREWEPYFPGANGNGQRAQDARDGMLQLDLATWLPDDLLVKVDRMSMAASLEARVPYLDDPLTELVASLPGKLKVAGGLAKPVLRAAVADLVPPEILNRRKQGLELPLGPWLRGPLRAYLMDVVAMEGPPGLFNEAGVRRYMNEHLNGTQDRARQLWTVLVVKLWYRSILHEFHSVRHEQAGVR